MSDLLARDAFMAWVRTEITSDEPSINQSIAAAESVFRTAAGRQFALVGAATTASARTFRPERFTRYLWIDDAAEITSVSENGTALTPNTNYLAEPDGNRDVNSGEWRPFDRLIRLDQDWYRDDMRRTVSVVSKWGWSTLPEVATEALKVIAADWQSFRNLRNGVMASDANGFAIGMRTNPLVEQAARALKGHNWGIA